MKLRTYLKIQRSLWQSRVRRALFGPAIKAVLYETEHGTFLLDPRDVALSEVFERMESYGNDLLDPIFSLVDRDSNVCVMGAHVGTLLIPIASRVQHVTGYEANPRTYQLLQGNIRLNNLHNVEIWNLAAGECSREIEFLAGTANSGGSKRAPIVPAAMYSYDSHGRIRVPCVALDEHLCPRTWNLILIDIEGSEYFALQGMQRTLEKTMNVLVEFLPHHLVNVAGVTASQFLAQLLPHFTRMQIIGTSTEFSGDSISPMLEDMMANGIASDLLFSK
jgi:FkbM family methyltransferase